MLRVIVETPRESQNKFDYDPKLQVFMLKKTLPMGSSFPFDFGFIPNTLAPDGDPMDVLVIMDQRAFPGCLVMCRAIGIIEADQIEPDKKKGRNDRVVAISCCSTLYSDITDVKELNKNLVSEIENFFIDYNRQEGKSTFLSGGLEEKRQCRRYINTPFTGKRSIERTGINILC